MLGIVTATTDLPRASACIASWTRQASRELPLHCVVNQYLGVVPAFRLGVDFVLAKYPDVDVVACLHDDLTIDEPHWDEKVEIAFERYPDLGLAGFGGAIGLGADGIYQTPYDPMQLARIGFRSNLLDAEAHGTRSLSGEWVVCLDGFSLIARREFLLGDRPSDRPWTAAGNGSAPHERPWTYLQQLGLVHHFYDSALGCLARRFGWRVRFLPVRCQHHGGRTAVGDPGYQHWAAAQIDGGDRGFWEQSHRIGYDTFKDVLPLRL
jgi:hypothetical protein